MEPVKNTSTNRKVKYVVKRKPIEEAFMKDPEFLRMKEVLPSNYNFEIEKTISKIKSDDIKKVALQFPEGLLMYACLLGDIFTRFTGVQVIILGDVTYGACCVDDFTSCKLGADLLVHYGHSCLVPVNQTRIKVLYVFVEIQFDPSHLLNSIKDNFDQTKKIALMGTIQFVSSVFSISNTLREAGYSIIIPQCKPLSPAETLGCTSPILPNDVDLVVFVADGRFHLEAAMIQNPKIKFFRYDPYAKVISSEGYDIDLMKSMRWNSICKARDAKVFGLILGTLGRQGNSFIFNRLKSLAKSKGKVVIPFLMAEINLQKLALITQVEAWVQVSCPRLSIDWGSGFIKPLLSPYEFEVALGEAEWQDVYPMDYYRHDAGPWTNYVAAKAIGK